MSGVVPHLTRYGLSVHADLIYRCLHLMGPMPAANLGRALDIPTNRVSAALAELTDCGAVEGVPGGSVWRARPAQAFLAKLRAARGARAAARVALVRHLSLADIAGLAPDRLADATQLTNQSIVRCRFSELVVGATTELLAMNPEAAFTRASAKAGAPASRSALRKGVTVHNLGVPAAARDESGAYAGELLTYGLQYREAPRQPVKLAVIDQRVALFPVDPAQNFAGGVWEISDHTVVGELVSFFRRHWEVAVPPSPGWQPPGDLTDRERAVLAALASGDTDDGAAQRLELSSRTIRYVISDLMERYQVRSRFQLGLVLGRLHQQTRREGAESEDR